MQLTLKQLLTQPTNVRTRSIALPTEHGGWGFVLEPILLGLLVAPTLAGVFLGVALFTTFLMRQPLKLLLKDVRSGRTVPRTITAARFTLLYGGGAAIGLLAALLTASTLRFTLPLLLALPLIGVQLWHDAQNKSRSLTAEISGAAATGAFAAALVLLSANWTLAGALALWAALGAKGMTAVLYVRSRLRLERGKPAGRGITLGGHGIALAAVGGLAVSSSLPFTAVIAMLILTGRSVVGLSSMRKQRPPKVIGFQELAYGLAFVALLAIGYW